MRRDFSSRAELYIENGIVEVEESTDQLAQEAREYYKSAGTTLSNGDAAVAASLTTLGLIPNEILGIHLSTEVAAVLTIIFLMVVMLRLSILDALLFSNPSSNQEPEKLLIIRDWNQGVASGILGFWRLVTLRVIKRLSQAAYDFYFDWVFYNSLVKNEPGRINAATKISAGSSLGKPFIAIVVAEMDGTGYRKTAEKWVGEDIFTVEQYPHLQFAQGEYADKLSQEKTKD